MKICDLPIIDEKVYITKKECLEEVLRVWTKIGRQPTTGDIKKGISKYSLNTFCRKFGSWTETLLAFDEFIHDENHKMENLNDKVTENYADEKSLKNKTNRDINLKLRWLVMRRDNFKCCACGSSPATDPSVVLHVDHIKPWSKGGETIIENLQTLCSKCNLGKSDLT